MDATIQTNKSPHPILPIFHPLLSRFANNFDQETGMVKLSVIPAKSPIKHPFSMKVVSKIGEPVKKQCLGHQENPSGRAKTGHTGKIHQFNTSIAVGSMYAILPPPIPPLEKNAQIHGKLRQWQKQKTKTFFSGILLLFHYWKTI